MLDYQHEIAGTDRYNEPRQLTNNGRKNTNETRGNETYHESIPHRNDILRQKNAIITNENANSSSHAIPIFSPATVG